MVCQSTAPNFAYIQTILPIDAIYLEGIDILLTEYYFCNF